MKYLRLKILGLVCLGAVLFLFQSAEVYSVRYEIFNGARRIRDSDKKAGEYKELAEQYEAVAKISGAQLKDYVKAVEYNAKVGGCYEKAGLFKEAGEVYLITARMCISHFQR